MYILSNCLKKKVDPATIILKSLKFPRNTWQPVIDEKFNITDPFIPNDPIVLLKKSNNFDKTLKSVIIGHNTEEGLVHMAPFIKNPAGFANISANLPSMLFPDMEIDQNIITKLTQYINI